MDDTDGVFVLGGGDGPDALAEHELHVASASM